MRNVAFSGRQTTALPRLRKMGSARWVFWRQTTAVPRLRIPRFVRIAGVECADNVRGVGGVGRRLPGVLGYWVSFPFYLVVESFTAIS